MAYTILTESYERKFPKITATADSTDDLAELGTNFAEGSTCVISDKTYKLDEVSGWVDSAGGGGGGGGSVLVVNVEEDGTLWTCDKTWKEIHDAFLTGSVVLNLPANTEGDCRLVTVFGVDIRDERYSVKYYDGYGDQLLSTNSENGYPEINWD